MCAFNKHWCEESHAFKGLIPYSGHVEQNIATPHFMEIQNHSQVHVKINLAEAKSQRGFSPLFLKRVFNSSLPLNNMVLHLSLSFTFPQRFSLLLPLTLPACPRKEKKRKSSHCLHLILDNSSDTARAPSQVICGESPQ